MIEKTTYWTPWQEKHKEIITLQWLVLLEKFLNSEIRDRKNNILDTMARKA